MHRDSFPHHASLPSEVWWSCAARVWVLVILVVTLLPFDFQWWGPERTLAERLAETREKPPHRFDAPGNVLLFIPFGLAAAASHLTKRKNLGGALLTSVGAGAALALAIETTQLFLPSRDPSTVDFLTNTLGTLLGAGLAVALGARIEALVRGAFFLRVMIPRKALVAVLSTYLVLVLVSPVLLLPWSHQSLRTWDFGYPLVLGREADGSRPWEGQLWRVEFAARALTDAEAVVAFEKGLAAAASFLGGYRMDGHEVRPEPADALPVLTWYGSSASRSANGSILGRASWLMSAEPPTQIYRAVAAADAFTLAVEFATADENQDGPARMVSFSADETFRNFTLAQWYDTLVVRLRTPLTGENGADPELYLPDVCHPGRRVHVIASFDGRYLRAWIDGRPAGALDLRMRPGAALLYRLSPFSPFRIKEYDALFAVLVFVPLGGLALLSAAATRRRFTLLWFGAVLGAAALFEGTLAVLTGLPFQLQYVLVGTALATATILLLLPCARCSRAKTR